MEEKWLGKLISLSITKYILCKKEVNGIIHVGCIVALPKLPQQAYVPPMGRLFCCFDMDFQLNNM